jgi:hypothetical protein
VSAVSTGDRPERAGFQAEQVQADVQADEVAPKQAKTKQALYPQLLRLQHVHPNAWQRAVLGEGMAGLGAVLAMADLASLWTIPALPIAVAALVKCHDLLAGYLSRG